MQTYQRKSIFLCLLCLSSLLAFGVSRMNFFEELERRTLDSRFKIRGPREIRQTPFQLVVIDDQTLSVLDQKFPYSGALYARLIRNLNRAGAKWIAFDISFSESNTRDPEGDSIFADAIREAGNVILCGKIAYTDYRGLAQPHAVPVPPHPVLAATGAPWGLINELTDTDDFTRRYLLYLPSNGDLKKSFGLEVLQNYFGIPSSAKIAIAENRLRLGDCEIPLFDRYSFLINYYGPAGTFPAISFSAAVDDSTFALRDDLDSDYMENFYRADGLSGKSAIRNPFAGKVVLVGVSAEELHDNTNTPFYDFSSTPRKTAGVEMHAHALQTILDRSFIRRSSALGVLALNLLVALMIFALVNFLKPLKSFIAGVLLFTAVCIVAVLLFAHANFWLDVIAPLMTLLFAYFSTSLYQYLRERREKTAIRTMFSHYVPDRIVEELIRNPALLKLGGEYRRITILFADINEFTALSEKVAPENLVLHLNEFMTAMTEIILRYGGIIDKYEGDLILAEFGVPVSVEDHCVQACRAALEMQQRLKEMRAEWIMQSKPPFTLRIGINTGEVIVGNMGSKYVFDYTVLGDPVNLCSRLEHANKVYGTEIIISEEVRRTLPETFVTRILDDLRVRGRSEAVRIFELTARHREDLSKEVQQMLEVYKQGWDFYVKRDWINAAEYFERALQLCPGDKPTDILLKRCRKFEIQPPPADWDGVYNHERL